MAFDMGVLIEKTEQSLTAQPDAEDAPPPDASTANQQTAIEDQSADSGHTAADSSGDESGAVPGAGGEQVQDAQPEEIKEPPETADEPATVQQVRKWGRGLETDLKAIKPVAEKINSLGGLELVESVASPILAQEFDAAKAVEAIRDTRGIATVPAMLRALIGDAEAIANDPESWTEFSTTLWNAFNEYGAFESALSNPALIRDEGLRARVEAFLTFEKSGPTSAPKLGNEPQSTQTDSQATPDNSDLDELEIPDSLRREIEEARALKPQIARLQGQIDQLKGYQESETERREREKRETAERDEETRRVSFMNQFTEPSERLIEAVRLSTDPDPQKAAAENQRIREDISELIKARVRADGSIRADYQKGYEAHTRGDRIAAAPFIQKLKEGFDRITKEVIREQSGRRLKGAVEEKRQIESQPQRTVITGTGGASPVTPPAEAARKAFDMSYMEQKATQSR